jgi:hypothetical protein
MCTGKSFRYLMATMFLVVLSFQSNVSKADNQVPHSDLLVQQFIGTYPLPVKTSDRFLEAVNKECRSQGDVAPPVAPIFAAFGGIIVDWIFGRITKSIENSLKESLKSYTAAYSNKLSYGDIFDARLWSGSAPKLSCVVAVRVDCELSILESKSDNASCPLEAGKPGFAVALLLRNERSALRVSPIAVEMSQLRAKHAQGDAGIGVSLRLKGFGLREGEGYAWESAEAVVLSETFPAQASVKSQAATATFAKVYDVPNNPLAWKKQISPYVAFPPHNVATGMDSFAAIEVTVAEVGTPSRSLKAFAEFFSENRSDISGALSAAAKKKLGVAE